MRTNILEDARGQRRKVCLLQEAIAESDIEAAVLAPPEVRANFWSGALAMGGMFTAVMIPLHGLVFSLLFSKNAFLSVLPFAPVYFFGFGLPMGWVNVRYGWRSARHARDALLVFHLCPHCAHGIGGIPPEPDGCTVCPECGAAWQVESAGGGQ